MPYVLLPRYSCAQLQTRQVVADGDVMCGQGAGALFVPQLCTRFHPGSSSLPGSLTRPRWKSSLRLPSFCLRCRSCPLQELTSTPAMWLRLLRTSLGHKTTSPVRPRAAARLYTAHANTAHVPLEAWFAKHCSSDGRKVLVREPYHSVPELDVPAKKSPLSEVNSCKVTVPVVIVDSPRKFGASNHVAATRTHDVRPKSVTAALPLQRVYLLAYVPPPGQPRTCSSHTLP